MSPTILVVGGAATGRAPMTAALLERLLHQRGLQWRVLAAGVVAHDDDPAEVEARDAMVVLGLNISDYRAQSLTDALMKVASVVVTVDSGTARVVRARYSAAVELTVTLGELAGRTRDIPDPFRMQIGAWITYAREIEALLKAGLERLIALSRGPVPVASETLHIDDGLPGLRRDALARSERLLQLIAEAPTIVNWPDARRQLTGEITEAGAQSLGPGDLAVAYAALLQALLNMVESIPSGGQLAFLHQAIGRLRVSVDQKAITELSSRMGTWATL